MSAPRTPDIASICHSHHCPTCGRDGHITVERVIEGDAMIARCHCRACGASWDAKGAVIAS